MPRTPGIILDFLAPRLFRSPTIPRGAWTLRTTGISGSRRSSSVALLKEVEVDREDKEERYQLTRRIREGDRYEGESVAGPSHLKGMAEGLASERYDAGVRTKRRTWLSPSDPLKMSPESAAAIRTPGQSRADRKDSGSAASPTDRSNPFEASAVMTASIGHSSRQRPWTKKPLDCSITSHFRQPNPPDPTHLLHAHSLTMSSGDLLLRYAERLGDHRTAREVRDKMGRTRLAPVRYMDPRQRGRRRLLYPKQGSQGRGLSKDVGGDELSESEEMKRVRSPLSPELKELRARSNIWARRMWPPLLDLPTFRDPTPQDFLRYQHHLLICASSPPSFREALDALSGMKGVKDRHLREMLHLFLVYTPYRLDDNDISEPGLPHKLHSGTPLSDLLLPPTFLHFLAAHPQIQPSRQTIHLLVRSILSAPNSFLSQSLKSARIRSLLSWFRTEWGISPGCETWRHFMKYALFVEDRLWGREIFDGWWDARERYMRGPIGDHNERRALYPLASTSEGQHADTGGGIDDHTGQVREDDGQLDELEDEHEVIFRFKHLGTHLSRWIRVVKQLETRGWVKRRAEIDGRTGSQSKSGWIWVNEAAKTKHGEE